MFGPQVDETMEKLKKDLEISKAVGILVSPRGFYKKQPFCGVGTGTAKATRSSKPTNTIITGVDTTKGPKEEEGSRGKATNTTAAFNAKQ